METARSVVLVAATVTTGLVAGLFYAFSIAVMPGLARTDDRTVVRTMRSINAAILNGWFLLGYLGALLFDVVAVVLLAVDRGTDGGLVPVVAATALYLAAVLLTARVNIPLNNGLERVDAEAGAAGSAAARSRFERPWVRANHGRTLLCTASFALLCRALLEQGTVTG
ncbi:anthrone oxygenase family protein [Streptomyces fragilis]|uniref:Anthrone oxygenase family protein n=1 Tax=Streptomyces fragilis TaxID=67301 RepID=A0ABV2YQH3_9ACTN|nr:anthrone oxygenase family protein [Streptomyces fragilis]